jgi:hypothetical protein
LHKQSKFLGHSIFSFSKIQPRTVVQNRKMKNSMEFFSQKVSSATAISYTLESHAKVTFGQVTLVEALPYVRAGVGTT